MYRSALVGVGSPNDQKPVIIVELFDKKYNQLNMFEELKSLAGQYDHTAQIKHFLIHDSFPVDIRHNAKIFREKLAVWATEKLATSS